MVVERVECVCAKQLNWICIRMVADVAVENARFLVLHRSNSLCIFHLTFNENRNRKPLLPFKMCDEVNFLQNYVSDGFP